MNLILLLTVNSDSNGRILEVRFDIDVLLVEELDV